MTQQPEIMRHLPVKLTEDEFIAFATELADVDIQIDNVEVEKKNAADGFKNRIGGLVSRKSSLRSIVKNKVEYREVPCKWTKDWASESVLLRRLDTQEVIDVRPMTGEELQESFDLTGDDHRLPEHRDESDPPTDPKIDPETGEVTDSE